jgi:hypothetical protein
MTHNTYNQIIINNRHEILLTTIDFSIFYALTPVRIQGNNYFSKKLLTFVVYTRQ